MTKAKRSLKRQTTPTSHVSVMNRVCIQGGMNNEWAALPVETLQNVQCVRLTAWSANWLMMICFGCKTPDTWSLDVVRWTIDHCIDLVRQVVPRSEGDDVEENISSDALNVLADDSCDDETPAVDSQNSQNSQNTPTKAKSLHNTPWLCVNTAKGDITLKVGKNKVIYIKVDGSAVDPTQCESSIGRFVELVISFKARQKHESGRVVFADGALGGGIVPECLMNTTDKGKITFDFRKQAWTVHYNKKNPGQKRGQKKHQSSEGLQIQKAPCHGTVLNSNQLSEVLQLHLVKARRLWNLIDKSGEARIPEGTTSSSVST